MIIREKFDVVIISGPTSGLGLELLRLLVRREYKLILIGRDLGRVKGIQDAASCHIQMIEVDLIQTMFGDKANCLEAAVFDALQCAGAGRVVFVNNAGVITPIGRIGTIEPAALSGALAVNVIAPAAICGAALKYVQSVSEALCIMNISSGAAVRPIAGWGGYCAGKAAARQLFEVIKTEQPSDRLRVEHIDPGVLDTKMQGEIRAASSENFPLSEVFQSLKNQNLLKSPVDVAEELQLRIEGYFEG